MLPHISMGSIPKDIKSLCQKLTPSVHYSAVHNSRDVEARQETGEDVVGGRR